MRIGGYASQIKAGTYQLAPSDTNKEIIDIITGTAESSSGSGGSDSSEESSEE